MELNSKKAEAEGFWLSYIDVLTLFFSIFLILYFGLSEKLKKYEFVDRNIARFSNSWIKFKREMIKLGINPQVDKEFGGWRIEVVENILFKVDEYDLPETSKVKIRKIAKIIREFIESDQQIKNSVRIVVGGHASRSGAEEYNLLLTYKRASCVAEILKKEFKGLNIPIEEVGYGYNYLKRGYEKNPKSKIHRRVTIIIQPIAVKYLKSTNE